MSEALELIRRAQAGDEAARRKVIEDNLRLVWSVARRFQNRGQELEDLYQIGCIGLVKAIDHFDLTRPVQLSTYAVPLIMGEIKRFLRDDGLVKVSRTVKEQGYKIKLASEVIRQECGREATLNEIAVATELSQEEILLALDANSGVDSIDRTICNKEGDASALGEFVPDHNNEQVQLENKIYVSELMKQLDELEQTIIRLRYFEDKTQTEIGRQLNISQVQVSRMEKRALRKMRNSETTAHG
jgi:RNA polymerase sporulation-specific sigma factor